jgi:hypothetical protein
VWSGSAVTSSRGTVRQATDPYLGMPLWLQIQTRHGWLWDYHLGHLDSVPEELLPGVNGLRRPWSGSAPAGGRQPASHGAVLISVSEYPLDIPMVVYAVMRVVTGDVLGTLDPASGVLQHHLLINRRGYCLDPGCNRIPE